MHLNLSLWTCQIIKWMLFPENLSIIWFEWMVRRWQNQAFKIHFECSSCPSFWNIWVKCMERMKHLIWICKFHSNEYIANSFKKMYDKFFNAVKMQVKKNNWTLIIFFVFIFLLKCNGRIAFKNNLCSCYILALHLTLFYALNIMSQTNLKRIMMLIQFNGNKTILLRMFTIAIKFDCWIQFWWYISIKIICQKGCIGFVIELLTHNNFHLFSLLLWKWCTHE